MKLTRLLRHAAHGPWGDEAFHLPLAELERRLAELAPPREVGEIGLLVSRRDNGHRETPARVHLTCEGGMPEDAWARDCPADLDSQLAVMRLDLATLIANGQPLSLSGDNLLINLDLSVENLPAGSRLGAGSVIFEVTPRPHNGCMKFRKRFGKDALALTADPRFKPLRLRGLYLKVIHPGEVAVGDRIRVISRAPSGIAVASAE